MPTEATGIDVNVFQLNDRWAASLVRAVVPVQRDSKLLRSKDRHEVRVVRGGLREGTAGPRSREWGPGSSRSGKSDVSQVVPRDMWQK